MNYDCAEASFPTHVHGQFRLSRAFLALVAFFGGSALFVVALTAPPSLVASCAANSTADDCRPREEPRATQAAPTPTVLTQFDDFARELPEEERSVAQQQEEYKQIEMKCRSRCGCICTPPGRVKKRCGKKLGL